MSQLSVSSFPQGIAFDSSGNIFVPNNFEGTISKYNPDFVYLSQFGPKGVGNDTLGQPSYIAFDLWDNIYAVNYFLNRVEEFNSVFVYQTTFGSEGSGNGQF
jgi:hypothetical protein